MASRGLGWRPGIDQVANDALFPLHHRSEVLLAGEASRLFAHLDDPHRLSKHMESRSAMTAGASMHVETDDGLARSVGSVTRMRGRVLGLDLFVEEVVTWRNPPRQKVWETVGEPHLLVIGAYRMGFIIDAVRGGSRLVVFIDYRLPTRGAGRWIGPLLGRIYAAWCSRRMTEDARAAFGALLAHGN